MESWLYCWSLAALLCSVAGEPTNGTGVPEGAGQAGESHEVPAAEILASLLEKGVLEVEKASAWRSGDHSSWSLVKAKKSQKKSPNSTAAPNVRANGGESTGRAAAPSAANPDHGGDTYLNGKSPSRALLSEPSGAIPEPVTGFVWPIGSVNLALRKSFVKGDRPSLVESQEDSGSGDPHVKAPSGQVTRSSSSESGWDLRDFMDMATSSPHSTTRSGTLLGPSTEKAISPDSAEMDHLLPGSRETAAQLPSPAGTDRSGFEAGRSQGPFTDLENVSARSTAQGAQGSTDLTLADTLPASVPPNSPPRPSEPPSDLIDIDYRDHSDLDDHLGYHPDSTKDHHDNLRPWPKHLYYDDFSPFDYVYPTPPFYADGYEDGGIEDDDDDDLEEVEDLDDEITSKDIRHFPKAATLTPNIQAEEKPTGHQDFPKYHPERNKEHTMAGSGENATECRNGYVRRNNSCKSLCEIYPTYCYNGGQCYIVENIGAFCRCNTQDYIWHKGLRCDSIITDFQVMCVAVGSAAMVLLLLFMMTVFFAKKLYLLKTENYKLRKRSRYRTPSELHNDNFSLSTIAEGSHPNEDPNAPQKVQDLPKACLKDEEPFNIQNSLSPKHECSKGDTDIVDVNCVLNNLT